MAHFDIEAIRTQVRAMDFVRGTPAGIADWRRAHEVSRHNHLIEDMIPTPNEDVFFAMMLEAVPPELTTQILLRLLDFPNTDSSLPITLMTSMGLARLTRISPAPPAPIP